MVVKNKSIAACGAVLGAGGLALVAIYLITVWQVNASWQSYASAQNASRKVIAEQVGFKLNLIGENLRTISLLPGVRSILRHAENLDDNGKGAIQQIYNNLALQVDVSEVYIIPASFDPKRLDPVTGKLEEPVIMFDELIIQAGKFADAENPFGAANAAVDEAKPEVPEEEIYEYEELLTHVNWFSRRNKTATPGFLKALPIYSGDAVITCDNTDYIGTRVDKDREGLIFSVPFYTEDNQFAGLVSAIIRVNALQALVPEGDYALKSPSGQFESKQFSEVSTNAAGWEPSLVGKGRTGSFDSSHLIQTADQRGPWVLASRFNADAFYAGKELGLIRKFSALGTLVVFLATLLGLFWVRTSLKQSSLAQHFATHDALTGLPNRRQFETHVQRAFENAKRGQASFVLYLDLDRFKLINDSLGHQVGDEVIKEVARRIGTTVRAVDLVARMGGDEFVVLLLNVDGQPEYASKTAERIAAAVTQPITVFGRALDVGVSIGIAAIDSRSVSTEEVVRHADLALFRAKNEGRAATRFYAKEMDAERERRQLMTGELKQAIAAKQFELHYQTIVNAKTGEAKGCEALLRWRHPSMGLVPPMDFIPLAEEFGLIESIGEWVLGQACEDAVLLPKHFRMAVNVSPIQLRNPAFPLKVLAALSRTGLEASRLELEFTESVLLSASPETLKMITQLRACGIHIALDDFGVGYSSMGYLKDFEFDRVKIDRSFIRNIGNAKDVAIFRAITDMSASLGLATTAEGIETEDQLSVVRAQGCTDVQGFLFSKPKPFAEVLAAANASKATRTG